MGSNLVSCTHFPGIATCSINDLLVRLQLISDRSQEILALFDVFVGLHAFREIPSMTPRMPRPCSVSGRENQGMHHLFLALFLFPSQRLAGLRHVSGTTSCCGDSEEMLPTDWVRRQDDGKATMKANRKRKACSGALSEMSPESLKFHNRSYLTSFRVFL